jgi:hypothetical protein
MLKLVKCDTAGLTARLGGIFCAEKQVLGMILIERSVRLDPATLTKTVFDDLIQKDQVIGTIKNHTVEDANTDRGFTDLPTGKRIASTPGLKKWNATFYKGGRWQNELYKLDGSERYAVIFVFADGSILVQQLKDGMIKGFDLTMYVGIKNLMTGAEAVGSTLMMDLEPSAMVAWQSSSANYTSDDIDFLEMQPIAEVNIIVPVLTAGQTSTTVQITQSGSEAPMIGLDNKINWKMVRNGVSEAVTNLTAVAGAYTFTHAALVANDDIYFKTEVAGYPVYVLGSGYFIGKSVPKKVA